MNLLASLLNRLKGDGLRARSLRSTMLTISGFGGQNLLRLGSNLILTRILFPEAFGLMALVQMVITGLALFSDFGINASIIQDKRGEDATFLNTAWTLKILRGILLSLGAALIAAPVARFYDEPMLAEIIPVAGLTALLAGLSSTRMATANRNLALGRLTALQLGTQFFGILVMILFAFWLESVWALVIGTLAGGALAAILSHIVLPGQPNRFHLEREAVMSMLHFGKYIFLGTIAGFLVSNGDRAILGKFVSLDTLAIYNIALFMALVPSLLAEAMIDKVIFPLYSEILRNGNAHQKAKVVKARFLLSAGLISLALVLALAGDAIITLLYDPRYEGAGPILVLAAVTFIPPIITMSYFHYPLAAGHSGRFATLLTLRAVIQTTALYLGITWYGIGGALLAPAVSAIAVYPFLLVFIRPYRAWDPRHDATFAALTMAIVALVIWMHGDIIAPLFTVM